MSETGRVGRLPWHIRDELGTDARRVYDRIVDGPRAALTGPSAVMDGDGRLLGPFNAMLASPAIGDALQQLGAAIRYGTSLPDRARELAILTVATHHGSEFEWYAHSAPASTAGLDDAMLGAIRSGDDSALAEADRPVYRAVRVLLRHRDLEDDQYEEAHRILGTTGMVELVTLVGYYEMLALSMRTFRVPTPGRAKAPATAGAPTAPNRSCGGSAPDPGST